MPSNLVRYAFKLWHLGKHVCHHRCFPFSYGLRTSYVFRRGYFHWHTPCPRRSRLQTISWLVKESGIHTCRRGGATRQRHKAFTTPGRLVKPRLRPVKGIKCIATQTRLDRVLLSLLLLWGFGSSGFPTLHDAEVYRNLSLESLSIMVRIPVCEILSVTLVRSIPNRSAN
jgi:hypothetical protein